MKSSKPISGILHEVRAERERQTQLWGDDRQLPHLAFSDTVIDLPETDDIKEFNDTHPNTTGWAELLVEEVLEAVDESYKLQVGSILDPSALREELVQVAALAVAWIEAIDET